LETLIAVAAQSTEVDRSVFPALGLVDDVGQDKAHLSATAQGIGIASRGTTGLAGVAIAVQNKRACLLGDPARERGLSHIGLKKILARTQVVPVLVREDLIPEFVPELSDPPPPFRGIT
jgi:hypothetical protein